MEIRTMRLGDIRPAAYNPRKDLQPGDVEFEKLKASVKAFGYVEPVIFNERTGNVVGGHQRLKVLIELGFEEEQAVVVDLDDQSEKVLNIALNKITGRWEPEKLAELLAELHEGGGMEITGFEEWELNALLADYDHIEDLLNEDFASTGSTEPTSFTMTFTLPDDVRKAAEHYMATTPNGKQALSEAIMEKVRHELK